MKHYSEFSRYGANARSVAHGSGAYAGGVHEPDLIRPVQTRIVLAYGGFDGFHAGHADWLKRLLMIGSEVIVGCQTDAFCDHAGCPAVVPFELRRAALMGCPSVSRVIPLDDWDQRWSDIVNYDISVLALCDGARRQLQGLEDIVQVVQLPI